MGATPWYASRESVMRNLDTTEPARAATAADEACAAATELIEEWAHRVFYPVVATRYFDWPNDQRAGSSALYLDENELISATTITAGGAAVAASTYWLDPPDGPPYTKLTTNLGGAGLFSSGVSGHQRAIAITGVFGYRNDTVAAGTLAEALDISETSIDVTDGRIGVGDLLEVESERLVVTDRALLDTGVNIGAGLDDLLTDNAVAVADGTVFQAGEEITVGTETMLITGIVGNNLTVKRAHAGSILAAHSLGADIYAGRRLTVERAAVGTTAATHADATAVRRWRPPAAIRALAVELAATIFSSGSAGHADEFGEGGSRRDTGDDRLAGMWRLARTYQRIRVGAI